MRRLTVTLCAIALVLAAGSALAADVTGTWTGQVGPEGGGFTITAHLKQEGAKLTGSVAGPQGEEMPITDGKVEGDKISFSLKVEFNGNSMKILHEGTVSGDEMKLSTKMEGGDGGPGPGGTITLKRSK